MAEKKRKEGEGESAHVDIDGLEAAIGPRRKRGAVDQTLGYQDARPPGAKKPTLVGVGPGGQQQPAVTTDDDVLLPDFDSTTMERTLVDADEEEPTQLAQPLRDEIDTAPPPRSRQPIPRHVPAGTFRPPAPGHNEVVFRRRSSMPAGADDAAPAVPSIPDAAVPSEASGLSEPVRSSTGDASGLADAFGAEVPVEFDPDTVIEADSSAPLSSSSRSSAEDYLQQSPLDGSAAVDSGPHLDGPSLPEFGATEPDKTSIEPRPAGLRSPFDEEPKPPVDVGGISRADGDAATPILTTAPHPETLEPTQIDARFARPRRSNVLIILVGACALAAAIGVGVWFTLDSSSPELVGAPVPPPDGIESEVPQQPATEPPLPGESEPPTQPANVDVPGADVAPEPTAEEAVVSDSPSAEPGEPRIEMPDRIATLPRLLRVRRAQELRVRARHLHVRRAFSRAEAVWHLALQHEPDHPQAVYGYARTLRALDRNVEAMPWAEYAVELSPDNWRHRELLGDLLRSTGRLEEAVVQYEEGLRRDVGNTRLELRLADARRGM